MELSDKDVVYVCKIAQAELLHKLYVMKMINGEKTKFLFDILYLRGEIETDMLFDKIGE